MEVIINFGFFILCGSVFAVDRTPPYITVEPPFEKAFYFVNPSCESKIPFTLPCKAEGSPPLSYKWFNNGQEVKLPSRDNRYTLGPDGSSLVYSEPIELDAGIYQCIVTNKYGKAVSRNTIVQKATVDSTDKTDVVTKEVAAGSTLKLSYDAASGSPKPHFHWFVQYSIYDDKLPGKLQQVKNLKNPDIIIDPDQNLWFTFIDEKLDNMVFRCVSYFPDYDEYKFGTRYLIKVMERTSEKKKNLEVLYVSKNVTADQGEDVEIFCIFGGDVNIPMLIYTKDEYYNVRQTQFMEPLNSGKSLLIKNITMKDAGIYYCEVAHIGVLANLTVNVREHPKVPKVSIVNNKVDGIINGTLELICRARGDPKPKISWTHNGIPQSLGPSNQSHKIVYSDAIVFLQLTQNDEGTYTCNASNSNGYDLKSISLVVLPEQEPKIISFNLNGSKTVNTTTILTCRAIGYPEPEIEWRKDNQVISGFRFTKSSVGDLQITNIKLEDEGFYTCTATNKSGKQERGDTLKVHSK